MAALPPREPLRNINAYLRVALPSDLFVSSPSAFWAQLSGAQRRAQRSSPRFM